MKKRLFFVTQKETGYELHRWLLFEQHGTFQYSDFYANKASMVKNCIETFQSELLKDEVIFENQSPGMIGLIQRTTKYRYSKETNYFDECSIDDHPPGCTCEGQHALANHIDAMGGDQP